MEPLFTNERGGEPKSMSDALLARAKPVSALTDEQLVDGPGGTRSSLELRAEMDAKLDLLNQADDDNPSVRLTRAQRGTLCDDLSILGRAIEVAEERESRARARNRPAGCWCLGLGGRGTVGITYKGDQPGAVDMRMVDDAGAPVMRAKEYCSCPNGIERREREGRQRSAWLSGYNARKRVEVIERNWRESGLPPITDVYPLDQYPQDTPEQRETIQLLAHWRPPEWLHLWGDMRRGKTTIVQGIGVKALSKGYTVKYFRVSSLLDHLRAGFAWNGKSQEELMAELTRVDFLILDDIGATYMSDYALDRIMVLLDERLNENRCTIFTSNYRLGAEPGERALVDALQRVSRREHDQFAMSDFARADTAARIEIRIREVAATFEVKGPILSGGPKKSRTIDW